MPIPADSSISGFFKAEFDPYYIWAPRYQHSSAGIRSLHYLCHALNEFGCEAYVAPVSSINPALRTPFLTPEIARNHYASGRTPIAVYPETVFGNPFEARHIARWLLNRVGHLDGPTFFPSDEELFYFAEWVLDSDAKASHLSVPVADLRIFNNDDNLHDSQRSGFCYYAHKYLGKGFLVPQEIAHTATSLCHDIYRSPEEIADILRRSTALYCFEETAIITEALLCGCPVVMMPSNYLQPVNWKADWFPPGCGWAFEHNVLDRLSREVGQFRKIYEQSHRYCWNTIHNFIVQTHHRFTLSKLKNSAKDESLSAFQSYWFIPPAERPNYRDDFAYAYSRLPVFAPSSNPEPLFEVARWLDKTVSTNRAAIPSEAFSPLPKEPAEAREPLSPEEESRLLAETMSALEEGDHRVALLTLKQLLAHDALNWTVYETLGQIHAEQGKLDEAAKILLKGSSLEFSSTNCLRKLAAVYAMQGEIWRTLAACAQILKREPDDAELHLFVRDLLVSTSPRFDNISWLAPEWTTMQAAYQKQTRTARALLDSLQQKARAILVGQHSPDQ